MLIIDSNARNMTVAFDLVQVKMLVEAIRTLQIQQVVEAAGVLKNTYGLDWLSAHDVQATCQSFNSVVGPLVDSIYSTKKLNEKMTNKPAPEYVNAVEPPPQEEPEKKPLVN